MRLPFHVSKRVAIGSAVGIAVLAAGSAFAVQGGLIGSSPACTPTPAPAAGAGSPSPTPTPTASVGSGLRLAFSSTPASPQPGERVTWKLSVTNDGDAPVTLTFPTSQDGDVVLRQNGVVKYRWSDGRAFAQFMRQVQLAAHQTATYSLDGTLNVPAGSYDLTATLSSDPAPPAVNRSFTVGSSASPSASASPSPTAGGSTPRPASTAPGTTATPAPTAPPSSTPGPSPTPTRTP